MLAAADLRERIRAALDTFLRERAAELRQIDIETDPIAGWLGTATGGGKLLRPSFCFWGFVGAGGDPSDERIVNAALVWELLHASALVHDDLIDRSVVRRGHPTAHVRFAALHVERRWTSDAPEFGAAAALLLGDLLLGWADDALAESGFPAQHRQDARRLLATARAEMIVGQYLDVAHQAAASSSITDALRVARLKSAKYTIERPLQLGAALAGGPAELALTFTAYGEPLGEAFQLCDDIAGVFGDPSLTGKPAGDDIREGKRTALLALAYDRADTAGRQVLDHAVGNPGADDTALDRARDVIRDSGARRSVADLVATRLSDALRAVERVSPPAREALVSLAHEVTDLSVVP